MVLSLVNFIVNILPVEVNGDESVNKFPVNCDIRLLAVKSPS